MPNFLHDMISFVKEHDDSIVLFTYVIQLFYSLDKIRCDVGNIGKFWTNDVLRHGHLDIKSINQLGK